VAGRDWRAWHDAYDDPGSSLAQRLGVVQERIADALQAGLRMFRFGEDGRS
jgi:hypothetical protein